MVQDYTTVYQSMDDDDILGWDDHDGCHDSSRWFPSSTMESLTEPWPGHSDNWHLDNNCKVLVLSLPCIAAGHVCTERSLNGCVSVELGFCRLTHSGQALTPLLGTDWVVENWCVPQNTARHCPSGPLACARPGTWGCWHGTAWLWWLSASAEKIEELVQKFVIQ